MGAGNPTEIVRKSIGKITVDNKSSSGFLILLDKRGHNFYCLMTNEQIITKEMIKQKKKIKFEFNNLEEKREIELNLDERFIKEFTDIDIDVTIIEILPRDKIKREFFLEPNKEYTEQFRELIDREITIIYYQSGRLDHSFGTIRELNKYEITINDEGLPGCPIFLRDSKEVVGIHKEGNKANFIGPIIKFFQNFIPLEQGNYYSGGIQNNLMHGKGKIYYKDGNVQYEGDFINDKFDGNGIYFDKDGNYYDGKWKKGLRHGKGITYFKDGRKQYDGDFVNGKAEGKGKYYYEDGNYYVGLWKNDLKDGKGTIYYKNGKIKFEGYFTEDKAEGIGKYYYEDGSYYEGEWRNDLMHGKGKIISYNGLIEYEGNFANDNPMKN